ncbi:component of SufBCD complex [Aliigemmobacter aestuarii]|uniref:Component of SufBCD complex n=1 Tax=Aliigemmobacter aestuarii TaxID=1445661 RepID=A0A4S3MLL7_9RHOB|nr:component of SufBCD complex [Gemmobacter aestuarii]THD83076.1 component of SufBCD complex [Gemmobacter aestuarii]
MQWYEFVYELIDLRSFSNLWFWIALAVMWSMASHWVLGVPYDMITRARRHGGQAQEDLEMLVRINANRMDVIGQIAGLWIAWFVGFLLTMLVILGFWYDVEFAQAVFCLLFPMSIVSALSLRAAHRIRGEGTTGEALHRRLIWHRMTIQGIGMISILLTSLWGMFQNLQIGVF